MPVVVLNGSPNEHGTTRTALDEITVELNRQDIETDFLWIGDKPIQGCKGCRVCRTNGKRCVYNDDLVNVILNKTSAMDGLIIGSPTYCAAPNGALIAALNRIFYAGGDLFYSKPGAAVAVARRAGTSSTLDTLNKYFSVSGMPIVSSCYWNMLFGLHAEETVQDAEGLQIMRTLARNMAWLLKCIKAGKNAGIEYPDMEDTRYRTNFVR